MRMKSLLLLSALLPLLVTSTLATTPRIIPRSPGHIQCGRNIDSLGMFFVHVGNLKQTEWHSDQPATADTRGLLVLLDGCPLVKRYSLGYNDKTRFISWSMTKSITAVLIGEMVADGKLSLDEPVPFFEWAKPGDPRGAITLRHMLHMSSGLDHTEGLDPAHGAEGALKSDTTQSLFVSGTSAMAARNIAKGLEAKPGTKFEYSSMTSLLLAELITRKLTDSRDPRVRASAYKAFAEERLFKPAGISSAFMEFDGAGTQIGGSIIHMTLDDWGRFGSLLMEGKGPSGSQVIAPSWLSFMRTPSPTQAEYGGHIWLNRLPSGRDANAPSLFPGKGPESLYAAIGHLGQYVIVSPEQRLVIVRLGKTNDGDLAPVRAALGEIFEELHPQPKRGTNEH